MFEQTDDSFKLTDGERKTALKSATVALLYILLGIVVLVTGAHGIMLVLSQESGVVKFSGLWGAVLDALRISFPITVELAAVVAGLGFVSARWRKGQVWVALAIEVVWVLFAAANMITFFAIERSVPLESWQLKWISAGLPLSALAAGILVYMLKRTDPDNKRQMEIEAAQEAVTMTRFAARRDVRTSPQMRAIERQREWLQAVQDLRTAGYTEAQIRFLLADTPELLVDGNKNGRPDLLESGEHRSGGPVNRPQPQQATEYQNGRTRNHAEHYVGNPQTVDEGNGYHVEVAGPTTNGLSNVATGQNGTDPNG